MKYQLVLHLPAASLTDYDEMLKFEEIILEGLGKLGKVDGHDAGSGETNIYIFTDQPRPAFDRIKQLTGVGRFMPQLKVAFRLVGTDKFTILYPMELTHFAIA
jgi:hypothetical protein